MKVQFENGYQTEMRDDMAKIYIARGKVVSVEEKHAKRGPGRPKKDDAETPAKTDEKSTTVGGVQRKPEADGE